jgi:hypothetical protein
VVTSPTDYREVGRLNIKPRATSRPTTSPKYGMRNFIDIMESNTGQHSGLITLYHITDKPRFKLNANYAPEDNATSIVDRSGNKGIYLTKDVEKWVNGHGYIRAFVAEILAEPSALDHDTVGRYGGEVFIPASQFDKLKVNRVVPIDVICREEFGSHGWIEQSNGNAFDTGEPITHKDWETPFRDWTYQHDTRDMSPDDILKLKKHFRIGYKARLKG